MYLCANLKTPTTHVESNIYLLTGERMSTSYVRACMAVMGSRPCNNALGSRACSQSGIKWFCHVVMIDAERMPKPLLSSGTEGKSDSITRQAALKNFSKSVYVKDRKDVNSFL